MVEYSVEGLDEPTTSFVLSLSATSKAVYFYPLSLSLFVPDSLDFGLSGKDENLVPAVPGENGIPAANYEEKSADESMPASTSRKAMLSSRKTSRPSSRR